MRDEQRVTDEVIMRNVGHKTPRQIAEMTGLEPNAVMKRARELLDSIDALTLDQQVQQILINLRRIARDAEDAVEEADDEFKAGLYNSAIAAYKESIRQLQAIRENQAGAVEQLNKLRISELLRMMDRVVFSSVAEIADKTGLPIEEILSVFQSKLQIVGRELEEA